ncbi:uncharacterized protein LOC143243176 isoform X4 [Tachypleus tridentatus]|uniref:uncharacterized protein LOC143243176 isoform X4 n=1 Tax=Tachypleus tridentatus TaxID=6853 RepID=UPI003FD6476D
MSLRDISFKEAVKLLRETASPVGCYRKSLNLIYNSPEPYEFYRSDIQKLVNRWQEVMNNNGTYIIEFIDDNQLSDNQVYRQPTFPLPGEG